MDGNLTPLQRFFLAFVAFFYVLANRRFAEEVKQVRERQRALPPGSPLSPPTATSTSAPTVPSPSPWKGEGGGEGRPSSGPAPLPVPPPAGGGRETTTATPTAAATATPTAAPAPTSKPVHHAESLHLLSLLQRDGRLLDFLSESLEGFSDSEIGAAARTVHEGCNKTLTSYLALEPVYREPEGASVTVASGFDPAAVRLTGNVVGAPPFKGSLRHHGWRATRVAFPPPPAQDPRILAPAEVEL